jgi:hypothetical protein
MRELLQDHGKSGAGSKKAVEARFNKMVGVMKNNIEPIPKVKKNNKTYLEQQTVSSLKAVLKYHKLPVSGSKPALISRLVEAGLESPESKKMVGVKKPKDEPGFEDINGRPRMSTEDLYNPEYMIPRKQYPKEKPLFKLRGKSTPTPRAKLQAQLKPALEEWAALKDARRALISDPKTRALQKELTARSVMHNRLGSIQNEDPEYLEEAGTYMKKPSLAPSLKPVVAERPIIVDSSERLGGLMYAHPSDPEENDFYRDMVEPHILLNNYVASFFRTYNNPNINASSIPELISDATNIFELLDTYENLNGEPAEITFKLSNGMQFNVDTGGFFEAVGILRPFLSKTSNV